MFTLIKFIYGKPQKKAPSSYADGEYVRKLAIESCGQSGQCYDVIEDHVWILSDAFKSFKTGDKVSFMAESKPYLKHRDCLLINFGLTDPIDIQKVDDYKQADERVISAQTFRMIMCEICHVPINVVEIVIFFMINSILLLYHLSLFPH